MNGIWQRPALRSWEFEVRKDRLEQAFDVPRIQADEDWPSLIDKVNSIDITIARDFFQKH